MGLPGRLAQTMLGNLSEVDSSALQKQFGAYLMDGEEIQAGFKLVRDAVLITNRRILDFDKQGATGQKMRVDSIYLSSIYHVSIETAGFGVDDSQLTLDYITTPYQRAYTVEFASKTYIFPKRYNIQGLYKLLQETAYQNYMALNSL